MKQIMSVAFGLLAVLATANPSQATYNNASLNGCYSYLQHTTDVPNHFGPPPLVGKGEEAIGVACFNGIGGLGGVGSDAYENVVNGVPTQGSAAAGSYNISGSGIGHANIPVLGHFGLVLNSAGGMAPSFQFMKINPLLPELIVGGTAYYQQAYPGASYTGTVLNTTSPTPTCYSWLEEGIAIAPTPTHNGKDELARFCFTFGAGQSGTVTQNGWTDVNGSIVEVPTTTFTGTYTVSNTAPYFGMGVIQFGPNRKFEFAVNNVGTVVPGLASSFQFTQIGDVPPTNLKITGGTAFLQQ
jgi:hypothetical protein